MLDCQTDPWTWRATASVLRCDATDGGWDVVLDATWLYPEGGGQPSDHGSVGGHAVRALRKERDGSVVLRLDGPVAGAVEVRVDGARRFDHMQQHTGQHLLTAVAQDRFGWATTAFHLGADRCDIELDTSEISDASMLALEAACNALIREARPVRQRLVDLDALASLPVRTRGLPEGFQGEVRLVEIEGLDLNTCGGTHLAHTGQLQALKLLGTERIRGGTRLFFWVGDRVLRALGDATTRERALTRLLSVGPDEHAAAVERLAEESRAQGKQLKALQVELATALGEALAGRTEPRLHLHRADADLPFLNTVAGTLLARRPEALILLTAGTREGTFLLAGPEAEVRTLGPVVAAALEGRGGGAKGRFQGKATRVDRASASLLESAEMDR